MFANCMVPQFLSRNEPPTITVFANIRAFHLMSTEVMTGKLAVGPKGFFAPGASERQCRCALIVDMTWISIMILNHMLLDSARPVTIADPHWTAA